MKLLLTLFITLMSFASYAGEITYSEAAGILYNHYKQMPVKLDSGYMTVSNSDMKSMLKTKSIRPYSKGKQVNDCDDQARALCAEVKGLFFDLMPDCKYNLALYIIVWSDHVRLVYINDKKQIFEIEQDGRQLLKPRNTKPIVIF